MFRRYPVDAAQRCKTDLMLPQQLRGAEDTVEATLPALISTVKIVQVLWTIYGQADKEILLMQKLAPGLVNIHPIGLEVVLEPHVRRTEFPLQVHDLTEKVQAQQGRLTALPGEDHLLAVLALEVLPDEGLKHLIGDAPMSGLPEQFLLREVIAVGAVEIAERPGRLHHDMHAPHGLAAVALLRGFRGFGHSHCSFTFEHMVRRNH